MKGDRIMSDDEKKWDTDKMDEVREMSDKDREKIKKELEEQERKRKKEDY